MLRALFRDISWKSCLFAALASILLAFGLYNIHAQADITEGGILGLSLFFDKVLHVSPAITTTVFNILFYLLGIRVLGRKFVVYSAVATAGFSVSYAIFEQFPPLFPGIAAYPLLASLIGALFVGIGCGVCVRVGGAPTGDDALVMSLSRIFHVRISWGYLVTDLAVLSLSLVYIPLSRILYSLLTVILSGQLVDLIQLFPIERRRKGSPPMPRYKIIFSDLDGTLLNSHSEVSEENLAAIRALDGMGVYFVPSSGRTLGELPPCVRAIPEMRYIVYSNGAVIYDTRAKKPLDTRCMKGDSARRALDTLFDYESLLLVHYDGNVYVDASLHHDEGYESYRVPPSYRVAMYAFAIPVANFKEFCYGLDEIEMICTFFRHDAELTDCRTHLLSEGAYSVAATEVTNIELTDGDAGKGNALWRLADLLGIDRADTVAVGDNINDLDNFSHAGLALATENAVEKAKRAAHRVICRNDEHAMQYILENIIKEK